MSGFATLGRALLAVALIWVPHPAKGAEITVRIVNGKTGRPMANLTIMLTAFRGLKGPLAGSVNDVLGNWQAVTGPDGRVFFPAPDPRAVEMEIGVWGYLKGCSATTGELGGLKPQEVLSKGFMERDELCDKKGKLKGKFSPTPGEVIVFAVRGTWWDHFLEEAW
jgi:hypothetical protein